MKTTRGRSALYARVERALALNRKAQLNFPGLFMDLTGRLTGDDGIALELSGDPTFRNAAGEPNWLALGVLVDVALGAVTRLRAGPEMRPATVRLDMQMTGAPGPGAVVADASFVSFSENTKISHALTAAVIRAGDAVIAHATGAFVMFDLPGGATQGQLPWLPEELASAAPEAVEFDDQERAALKACRRAEAAATETHPFIDHFWCGIPSVREDKASLDVAVTPHLGNRVGQVHGGVLLGMAARVASAAVPSDMRLSNITAWFVSPGLPPRLKVRSTVVQRGRTLAVVRTRITGAESKLVLDVTSQHLTAKSDITIQRETHGLPP